MIQLVGCHFIGCRWYLAKKTLNWIIKLQSVAAKKHFSLASRMDLKEANYNTPEHAVNICDRVNIYPRRNAVMDTA